MSGSASSRVMLVHTTAPPMGPIQAASERDWPKAHVVNLLDDSLSVDGAREAEVTPSPVLTGVAIDAARERVKVPALAAPDAALAKLRSLLAG